jgi:hypothetical protein
MGKMRNVYQVLVGKSKGNIPLRKPRGQWEDIIKTELTETRCEAVKHSSGSG